jgi:uncharacterized protein YggU (UPF0235/DUF167 family)
VRLTIRVRPGASRTAVGGAHDGALVVRVAARAVELVSGSTSRTKVVDIAGADPAVIARLLDA